MEENTIYKIITVSAVREEVKGVKTFVFDEEQARVISYKPGQYLTFVHRENGSEIRRSYSITSAPVLNEPLAIGVKRVDNGIFSRHLIDRIKKGDTLATIGAGGFFVLPDDIHRYRQLFFLAAGIGITPEFSLIKTVLHAYPHLQVVLIYSNISPESTAFLHPLRQLAETFPDRFRMELLFSNSANLYRAHLHADLLVSFLHTYAAAHYPDILFYICGPVNYMRLCTYTLQRQHVPEANIKKENFFAEKKATTAQPPDKDMHTVHINYKGTEYSIPVQYPVTILQAAKKQGLVLPFSCEAGVCGNCAAHCLQGNVWLSNNEVLTGKELSEGLVLTCTGYPVEGDVVISIP